MSALHCLNSSVSNTMSALHCLNSSVSNTVSALHCLNSSVSNTSKNSKSWKCNFYTSKQLVYKNE